MLRKLPNALAIVPLVFSFVALGGFARAAEPSIVVRSAWSRPATTTAVVYAVLHNPASFSDRLVGAVSPVASRITLHETSEVKMQPPSMSMNDMPMTGSMTSMKALSSIPIPAHGTTLLKPGGYHLMLDLRRSIKAGQTITLRLHFARAGWVATSASVRVTP